MLKKAEVVIIAVFTIAVILVVSLFVLNIHIFDPFKRAFEDFSYTDIYYSKIKRDNHAIFPELVLVNIGRLSRSELAREIEIIKQVQPKVIGIDVFFDKPKDSSGDSLLARVINSADNIILAAKYENYDPENKTLLDLRKPFPLLDPAAGYGFLNIGSDYGHTSTVRYFFPYVKNENDTIFSFAAAVAQFYKPSLKEDVMEINKLQTILYTGTHENFMIIDSREVFSGSKKLELLKDKIVLMGYLGDPLLSPFDIEDKHFTPFNEKISGRSNPDMYGVAINANIIRMLLDNRHLNVAGPWAKYLITFVLVWLHIGLFVFLYQPKLHKWYHVSTKLFQLVSSALILYIVFYMYHFWNLYFDPTFAVIIILFSVDLIYLYEGLILLISRRFKIKSMFVPRIE